MKRSLSLAAVAVVLSSCAGALLSAPHNEAPLVMHVSPIGHLAPDGSVDRPFGSPDAALQRARELKREGVATGRSIEIRLQSGRYERTSPLVITAEDSGPDAATPLVIRAAESQKASLFAGHALAVSKFDLVADPAVLARLDPIAHGKVKALRLPDDVASIGPYPDLFSDHGGVGVLFYNGRRMPIARWPADGYAAMDGVIDSGIEPRRGGTFRYAGNRPDRWRESLKRSGVWLVGYWRVPWVAQGARVADIDTAAKTITLAKPIPLGIGSKYTPLVNGTRAGDRKEPWFAINVLEELTQPGQWCLDAPTRTLYFWPPEDIDPTGHVLLTDGKLPAVRIAGAKHLVVDGLSIEGSLDAALEIGGGAENVIVRGCAVRHTANVGIRVADATAVQILSCDIYDTGAEGLRIGGGERISLKPSLNRAVNNHIHHTGRIAMGTYAVEVDGVGVELTNNLVHDTPLGGIQFRGNDHRIERNEIHNIGLEGGDLGGIYTNGDWAARGNVVSGNFVHHALNANAIYLDDGHSGTAVHDNIVYRCRAGIFIGGGHDNIATGNLIVDSEIGLHLDDRGLSRNYTLSNTGVLTRVLRKVDLKQPPWSIRYSDLHGMLARPDDLPRPTGNRITDNRVVGCAKFSSFPQKPESAAGNTLMPNEEIATSAATLADPARFDFRPAGATTQPSPLSAGLVVDAWRTALPDDSLTGRFETRPPKRMFQSDVDIEHTNRQSLERPQPQTLPTSP